MIVTMPAASAVEPVGLAEAKDYLRISGLCEDGAGRAVAEGVAVSLAEEALESANILSLNGEADVIAFLGDPQRLLNGASAKTVHPYREIARHLWEAAGVAGMEASEHRLDLDVVSRTDGGTAGVRAIAAIRAALGTAEPTMEGWRCVLLVPPFADTPDRGRRILRAILRMRAVV